MRRPVTSRLVLILLLFVQGGLPTRACAAVGVRPSCCDASCPMHATGMMGDGASGAACDAAMKGGCAKNAAANTVAAVSCPMHALHHTDQSSPHAARARHAESRATASPSPCAMRAGRCGGREATVGASLADSYLPLPAPPSFTPGGARPMSAAATAWAPARAVAPPPHPPRG